MAKKGACIGLAELHRFPWQYLTSTINPPDMVSVKPPYFKVMSFVLSWTAPQKYVTLMAWPATEIAIKECDYANLLKGSLSQVTWIVSIANARVGIGFRARYFTSFSVTVILNNGWVGLWIRGIVCVAIITVNLNLQCLLFSFFFSFFSNGYIYL